MIRGLALCAGVGGLELGLRLALEDDYRCVGYVEREAFAAAVLVARMADEALDPAPIWDDLATFDGERWRESVDLVSAGFPCQPASVAGRRAGQLDERWLWPHVARVVAEVEPRFVFLENVPGLLSVDGGAAFGQVLSTLAALGFDAEWDHFSAAGVGAPHLRKRLFLLAHAKRGQLRIEPGGVGRQDRKNATFAGDAGAHVSDAERDVGIERGWWAVEPELGRVAHGVADRVDRLRGAGNGVVPLVAAHAFRTLADRLLG